MEEAIKYVCSCCGKDHEAWPALAFSSPHNYEYLSEEDKQTMAELNFDFCVIRHADQTDRFIRCTLTQKVINHCEDLEYGLWVSLSKTSYDDYYENFNTKTMKQATLAGYATRYPDMSFNQASQQLFLQGQAIKTGNCPTSGL